AGDAAAGDELVHPVQRAQERRLAATGGADQRRHRLLGDVQGDRTDPLLLPVEDGQVADDQLVGRRDGGGRDAHPCTIPAVRRTRARTRMAAMLRTNVSASSTSTVAYRIGLVASTSGDCVEST